MPPRRGQTLLHQPASFYPASSGRRRGAGARHSHPSSRAANCAEDSPIRPVVLDEGQTN